MEGEFPPPKTYSRWSSGPWSVVRLLGRTCTRTGWVGWTCIFTAHERIQPEVPVQPEVFVELEAFVEPEAPIRVTEEAIVESISSSETESDQGHDMVTRRSMTISRFVPDARPTAQQQRLQGQDQTPPPPSPASRTRKRPRTVEQTSTSSIDAPTRTPLIIDGYCHPGANGPDRGECSIYLPGSGNMAAFLPTWR